MSFTEDLPTIFDNANDSEGEVIGDAILFNVDEAGI